MPLKLSIPWSLTTPLVTPKTWFSWPAAPGATSAKDNELEARAGWPLGTIAVLQAAFDRGLGRFQGWDLSHVTANSDGYLQAASIYKRGVTWRAGLLSEPARASTGEYTIKVPPTKAQAPAMVIPRPTAPFYVFDQNVVKAWQIRIEDYRPSVALSVTEHSKTLATVAELVAQWRLAGSPKHWVIIGGGVLADMAAFAATVAGAVFTLVPTTLLAMADACVGGKTGVNFPPFGKNQVGAFAFPEEVVAWAGWLGTLDERNLRSGLAECFKHAFLTGDRKLTTRLTDAANNDDLTKLEELLPEIIQVKAKVVVEDPAEAGLRATLNFGHTLAHALEAISHGTTSGEVTILHGEAVGVGMAFAAILSNQVTGFPGDALALVLDSLTAAGCLPSRERLEAHLSAKLDSPALWQELMQHVRHDKKASITKGETTRWVLLSGLGKPVESDGDYTVEVTEKNVQMGWQALLRLLK